VFTSSIGGAGIVVVMAGAEPGALVLIPESSGLLPPWCPSPDPTGQAKLDTLAQELGMQLIPESHFPTDTKTGYVKTLSGALARAVPAEGAAAIPLQLALSPSVQGSAYLVWPVTKPATAMGAKQAAPAAAPPAPPAAKKMPLPAAKKAPPPPPPKPKQPPANPQALPQYAKSLLKIQVPVVVTLARKRQPLGRVLELGPGSILQFDKSCEEMLELDVGGLRVALGEAIKVGDKFGLRIVSMVLPEERFQSVPGKRLPPSARAG
jgi:flagellar motor switch/type III secretory pathway protein FliN